jgi:hypothetical protein
LSRCADNLTEAERTDYASYEAGEVIQFHQNSKGFKRGERVTVLKAGTAGVDVTRSDGSKALRPYAETGKIQVHEPQKRALAEGDKPAHHPERTCAGNTGGASERSDAPQQRRHIPVGGFTRGGDIKLTNGFVIPKNYGGMTHGYVVTSHASQGKDRGRGIAGARL